MKDKNVNAELEAAQKALAESEAVEKSLREEYQAMLNDKLAVEMNLGSISKSAERNAFCCAPNSSRRVRFLPPSVSAWLN